MQRMFIGFHAISEKGGVIHLPSFLYLEQQQPICHSSFLTLFTNYVNCDTEIWVCQNTTTDTQIHIYDPQHKVVCPK